MKQHSHTLRLTRAAMVAALYVALTFLSSLLGIASGVIQCRLSEALCILPCFFPEATAGLTLGCLLANLLTGAPLPDILFGSLATLLGALGARVLRRYAIVAPLPTVAANALIIPPVLIFAYGVSDAYPFLLLTVTLGELLSAWLLGLLLHRALVKRCKGLFTKL